MQPTVYQKPEIRDANDNVIQQGAFGKNTALCNATNNGWIDYVMNNLEFLYGIAKDEVVPVPSLPASGQTNKTYLLTTTGVSYRWSGTQWVAVSSSEAVGRAETAATNAQNYANAAQQSADDAQDTADDIAEHLAQIDRNTGGVSANSKRISNIEKLLQGNLYDYDTDYDVAYTKTVPSGALPYAGIEQIGGKTLVWNQLVNSGTTSVATTSGHKYYTLIDGTASIVTSDGTDIAVLDDTTDMVFDLTLMFGSGNELTTIEQFREMFPSDYYENNSGELLSAGVTEVVSKKADTTTLATYSVPAEIQALEGYGWSAGTAYNYIDYERRVFVKNVGKVDLGTLNWEYSNVTGHLRFYAPVSDIYISGSQVTIGNLIIDKYVTSSVQAIYINANDKICAPHNLSQVIWIYDSSYTDKTAFKSAMNGVYAYYQLANPIETDISAYLSDDNLIEVESSGTLTMYSDANGDDDAYHIPVPSTVEYMIDLNVATGGTENEP